MYLEGKSLANKKKMFLKSFLFYQPTYIIIFMMIIIL